MIKICDLCLIRMARIAYMPAELVVEYQLAVQHLHLALFVTMAANCDCA